MPIVKLTTQIVQNDMSHYLNGKNRIELCDTLVQNLYLEVRSTNTGSGTFYLRFKGTDGKTRHHRIGTTVDTPLTDARQKATVLKAEIANNPDFGKKQATKVMPTFGQFFLEHYMPHARNHKRTWSKDLQFFNLRIKDVFGKTPLDKVERSELQKFHSSLKDQGLADATANHHLKLIKHCYFLAIDWGFVENNPATRIKLFREDNQVENYLDDEQIQRLMIALNEDSNKTVAAIILYLLSTGARLNEALQAKWEFIDKPNRVWRIPSSVSKSKKVRAIPLNDTALGVLNGLDTEGKYEYVFVNKKTETAFTCINKVWNRVRSRADLNHVRCHDLRHTFASALCNGGRTLFEIQSILGHSNPSVTMRYAHLSTKTLQEAANTASLKIQAAIGS
jgi:integrase